VQREAPNDTELRFPLMLLHEPLACQSVLVSRTASLLLARAIESRIFVPRDSWGTSVFVPQQLELETKLFAVRKVYYRVL